MRDPFDLNVLDPQDTKFFRTVGGLLAMRAGGTDYPEVSVHRAFPFSHTNRFISIRNPKGEEIGLLEQLDGLDAASFQAVEAELRIRYMTPQVTRIEQIRQTPAVWLWQLQTTKGPVRLAMRNLHEHMQSPVPGRLLLSDLEGNRVEIADYRELDAHSRKQLERIL